MTTAEIWSALVERVEGNRPGEEVAAWIEQLGPLEDKLGADASAIAAIDFARTDGVQQLREQVRALAGARHPSLWIGLRARRVAVGFVEGTIDLADGIKEMHRIRLSPLGGELIPACFSAWAADLEEVPLVGARKSWDDAVVAARLAEAERYRARAVTEARQLLERLDPLIARCLAPVPAPETASAAP